MEHAHPGGNIVVEMAGQREIWEYLGTTDADWAVASAPGRRHGAWTEALDEFYASGEARVDTVLAGLPSDVSFAKVLDYGSGTGRLSFALARRFVSVTSADVSTSMLGLLRERAGVRDIATVHTVDLTEADPTDDHSVAISLITLQHLERFDAVDLALRRIAAALLPGGIVVVDFPTPPTELRRRIQLRYRAYQILRAAGLSQNRLDTLGLTGISMLFEVPAKFISRLERAGFESITHTLAGQQYSVQATYVARKCR